MSKILFRNSDDLPVNENQEESKEVKIKPNLFLGRMESDNDSAKFPDWDIEPQNQIINPRVKPNNGRA